ncbi:hypothetical protein HPB49_009629 [Dermacentor silvarum]|uniref:Uncharacterized protein n=1 Tax=Dermacentor silvarum TaxID=543639 RepID=A0ACB8CWE1_DERSI|nr:hypothetical protein HPB49_009629 [Dermacentor silvarum]
MSQGYLGYFPAPPPFLPAPGDPAVSWQQWKRVFLNFLEAIGGDELQPKRCRAILLNSLGVEGQRIFCSILVQGADVASDAKAEDTVDRFKAALAALDTHFASATNYLVEGHRFRQRRQLPVTEPVCYFMAQPRAHRCWGLTPVGVWESLSTAPPGDMP